MRSNYRIEGLGRQCNLGGLLWNGEITNPIEIPGVAILIAKRDAYQIITSNYTKSLHQNTPMWATIDADFGLYPWNFVFNIYYVTGEGKFKRFANVFFLMKVDMRKTKNIIYIQNMLSTEETHLSTIWMPEAFYGWSVFSDNQILQSHRLNTLKLPSFCSKIIPSQVSVWKLIKERKIWVSPYRMKYYRCLWQLRFSSLFPPPTPSNQIKMQRKPCHFDSFFSKLILTIISSILILFYSPCNAQRW